MLVLTRKVGQKIVIGNATVVIRSAHGKTVSVGIEAPKDVRVIRGEIKDKAA